jgi:hypothetical protein
MEPIRLDGFQFMELLLTHYPEFISQYSDKLIPHCISFLSSSDASVGTSTTVTNPKSLLGLTKVLLTFESHVFLDTLRCDLGIQKAFVALLESIRSRFLLVFAIQWCPFGFKISPYKFSLFLYGLASTNRI